MTPAIAVRSGDTPASERARFQREPADILITTPESLYLLLTSNAREVLRSIDTAIVDEIHALVPTKRGAHLALSIERLAAFPRGGPACPTVGLSATVRPVSEVATFLGGPAGDRGAAAALSAVELTVVVPVEDVTELDTAPGRGSGDEQGRPGAGAVHLAGVEERVLDLIEQHQSTIVFADSRRLADELCGG